MRTFFKLTLASVVAALMTAMPSSAEAAFQLKITSSAGGGTTTIADVNADGSISYFNANYNGFNITVAGGT